MDPRAYNQARILTEPGSRSGSRIYHVSNGYYYTFNSETISTLYFRCTRRSCHGRAMLRLGQGFLQTQDHDHPANELFPEIQAARRLIVDRARSIRYVSFAEIVEEERRRIPNRAVRLELTRRRLRSAMQRARADVFPNLPRQFEDLIITLQDPLWESLTKTIDLQDSIYSGFVRADDGSLSIVFISERCIQLMREASVIFVDGTFKITPARIGCYQILTVVTISGHTVIPLMWCLMERKTERAYTAVFLHLRARLVHWEFRLAICDYEDGLINSLEAVLGVNVQGCYFHYVNDVASWAKTNLTVPVLAEFPQLIHTVRLCCALPLLPQYLLQLGMDIIRREAINLGPFLYFLVNPFLEYVQTSWLQHANRGRTLSVCGSDNRTNNASESNNHRMNNRLKVPHPNVYHLIRSFVEFEDSTIDDMQSLARGIIPSRHRATSAVRNDVRVNGLTALLLQNPYPCDDLISQFLHAAAYTMDNVAYDAMGFERPRQNP